MREHLLFRFIAIFGILFEAQCHCPHMAKFNQMEKTGPQPPGALPDGDKGWDWDETRAPGSVPEDHYIQTTFIHRSNTESDKIYARNVMKIVKEVQERLKREARVTIDNENIECNVGDESYRCADYPGQRSYHFLIVEDSAKGAAVYSIDKKYNEKELGSIEMALLDAFSRHSPTPLTVFASKAADPHVGFVRELSAKEISAMGKPSTPEQLSKFSPLEFKLVEPTLLELRHGEGLDTVAHKLTEFSNQKEFDIALKEHKHVFVLFWTNVFSLSLHQYNLWARTSNLFNHPSVLLAHVRCHINSDFCEGLKTADFNTIVAYEDGVNVGTTQHLSDVKYYQRWIQLVITSPFIELQSEDQLKSAKKGQLEGIDDIFSITIGVFSDKTSTEFSHFKIAAEKLRGRYPLAFIVKQGAQPSLSSYRLNEKKKRVDYDGSFDPASLITFISNSQLPSIVDITSGFTTDALFRQNRIIICLLSSKNFDRAEYEKLAARDELRKSYSFTRITREGGTAVDDTIDRLFIENGEKPTVILFDKDRVFFLTLTSETTSENILTWAQQTHQKEPELELSLKDVHPLRLLQVGHVNDLFGKQNTVLLPDHTLFKDMPPSHPSIDFRSAGTGGCPFMAGGGGGASHDEL